MRYPKILALLPVLLLFGAPTFCAAAVDVSFSVSVPPPELPVYEQPPLPEPGYLWSPGYWAWDGMDYYWVPGTWVLPPASDMLWTPGYWGWRDGFYGWNPGYWGPEVGYYGGVNYGFGYTGVGYQGGYWHGGAFFYNRSVANFGRAHIVNVYDAPVRIHERSRISFNGGQGGLRWQPSAADRTAMNEHHRDATPMQRQHQERAAAMPDMHMGHNGGHPQILATQRPADFTHPGPGLRDHQQPALHEQPELRQTTQLHQPDSRQRPDMHPQPVMHQQPEVRQGYERHQQPGPGVRDVPQRRQGEFPQQHPAEQPHVAGPRPGQGPGPGMRAPDRQEAGPRPEMHGGPPAPNPGAPHGQPHEQPRPQGPHEQGRREPEPKHER